MPGGDDFGARPIDMHLKGLEALGAHFELRHGYLEGHATGCGASITLGSPAWGDREHSDGGRPRQGHHRARQRRP